MEKRFSFKVDDQRYSFNGNNFRLFYGKEIDNLGNLPVRKYIPSLRTLALTITNDCNLGCYYCYANKGHWDNPGKQMGLETAQRSVDLLAESVLKNGGKLMTVSFFGGEPLLRFDFIQKIVCYVEKTVPKSIAVRFAIVTNGTLLSQDVASFLKEKNFIISLSIDGPKEVHDMYRVFKQSSESSYDKIVANYENIPLGVLVLGRITVSNHNYDINSVVQHIHSLGINRMSYELDHNLDPNHIKQFLESSNKVLQYYVESIKAGVYFDLRNITRIIASILLKRKAKSHCNANTGYMCVSADGFLYPCHRFIGYKELVLGHVNDLHVDYLQELIYNFDSALGSDAGKRNKKCHGCPFTFICGGNCFYHSYLMTGRFFEVMPADCLFKRNSFKQALRLMCSLTQDEWKKYLSFLKRVWAEEDRLENLPNL